MPAGNGGDKIITTINSKYPKNIQVILKLIQINDYSLSKVNLKKRQFVIFENPMEVGL